MADDKQLEKVSDDTLQKLIDKLEVIVDETNFEEYMAGEEYKVNVEVLTSLKELKQFRGLAGMRKDMLDADIGVVLGGYSEDELRICKNCKWFGKDIYDDMVCENELVGGYTTDDYPYNTHLAPPEDFGCNKWEKKG